jgi:hypothetical protein
VSCGIRRHSVSGKYDKMGTWIAPIPFPILTKNASISSLAIPASVIPFLIFGD